MEVQSNDCIVWNGYWYMCVYTYHSVLIFVVNQLLKDSFDGGLKHDSTLLYYLIREIKMWLNINHITVHINTYILKLKEIIESTKVTH